MMKKEKKAMIGIATAAIMIASVMIAMVPVGSAQIGESLTGIKLWHILLAISFFFAILTFSYPLIMRIMRKRREEREKERLEEKKKKSREEEVIEILKEIEELKEKIEKRGVKLTSISDVFLVSVQILAEIRVIGYRMEGLRGKIEGLEGVIKEEIGDMRALILFGITAILAISLTIISLL